MPFRRMVLLAGMLGLTLALIPAVAITGAQDSTPTPIPTFAPTPPGTPPVTPDDLPVVARVPFTETFDTRDDWTPAGTWEFRWHADGSGGAWFVDLAQRETINTLSYMPGIDLSGTLNVRLMFRQTGIVPESDLVAVDVSLDGGHTWNTVDVQVGLSAPDPQTTATPDANGGTAAPTAAATPDPDAPLSAGMSADWELRTVDLASYRGQVIALRFRVQTGLAPLEGPPITGEYGIDNVVIQFFENPPEPSAYLPVAPPPAGPRTLMGLHLVVGAQKEPVVDLAKRLREIGWPLGTLKGTSGTTDILAAVAEVSPETVLVFRSLETPRGLIDCPNDGNDPIAEAHLWMAGIMPYWVGVQADYFEIMNECLPPVEWLVPFTIEAMNIANQRGYCILAFSFPPGNPEPWYYAQLQPVYEYALANPCGPGRYHGVALHAYGVDTRTLVSESDPAIGLRHRLFYREMVEEVPEAVYLPLYLTEAGPGDGSTEFECPDVVRDVVQYTRQLEFDPYVRGFHLWNVGKIGEFIDVTRCLPQIGDALVGYYASR